MTISYTYTPQQAARIHADCCDNAERLLAGADRMLQAEPLPNLAYHLATLAMEEVGKAGFVVTMAMHDAPEDNDWATSRLDDHEAKLMWALWTPLIGTRPITRQNVEEVRELARSIHERRMSATYVSANPDASVDTLPANAVALADARLLVDAVRERLGIERKTDTSQLGHVTPDMQWFLAAVADVEKRRQIFSAGSFAKLSELGGDARAWATWLRNQFEQAQAEAQELVQQALTRAQPAGADALKYKWLLHIRLHSSSHAIRPKVLASWNRMCDWLHLVAGDKGKKELFLDIKLRASVRADLLWYVGFGAARQFVTALNIGTMGYFWWYLPQQTTRYYDRIRDLDAPGNFELAVDLIPKLQVDWGNRTLSQEDIGRTGAAFGMMARMTQADQDRVFGPYAAGLMFVSKSDVHFRFAADAARAFAQSLFEGMRYHGDWDGDQATLDATVCTQLGSLVREPEWADLPKRASTQSPEEREKFTVDEALRVKCLCDYYFLKTAKKQLESAATVHNASD